MRKFIVLMNDRDSSGADYDTSEVQLALTDADFAGVLVDEDDDYYTA